MSEDKDKILTAVGFETSFGYKRVEVREGDISKSALDYDLLVTSAISGGYNPVPGTLFHALHHNLGIDMTEEHKNPYMDLTQSLSIWISRELANSKFNRILCAEITGAEIHIEEVFENVFAGISLMEAKGIKVESLAMPLLGTGHQGIPVEEVIPPLLEACKKALDSNPSLDSITFLELHPDKARKVVETVNHHLGRKREPIPKGKVSESVRKEILEQVHSAKKQFSNTRLWKDMANTFSDESLQPYEVGVLARRLLEVIVKDIVPGSGSRQTLNDRMRHLKSKGIAQWITSYMHVLRILGNNIVHESLHKSNPEDLDASDLLICLFCINKILHFWLEAKESQGK